MWTEVLAPWMAAIRGFVLTGVTMISMAGTLIFWGANPRIPIG